MASLRISRTYYDVVIVEHFDHLGDIFRIVRTITIENHYDISYASLNAAKDGVGQTRFALHFDLVRDLHISIYYPDQLWKVWLIFTGNYYREQLRC